MKMPCDGRTPEPVIGKYPLRPLGYGHLKKYLHAITTRNKLKDNGYITLPLFSAGVNNPRALPQ